MDSRWPNQLNSSPGGRKPEKPGNPQGPEKNPPGKLESLNRARKMQYGENRDTRWEERRPIFPSPPAICRGNAGNPQRSQDLGPHLGSQGTPMDRTGPPGTPREPEVSD